MLNSVSVDKITFAEAQLHLAIKKGRVHRAISDLNRHMFR